MKAVQITMDEALLAQLDENEEVKRRGRSAVIRAAVEAWLKQRREEKIVEEYRRAYADSGGLGAEWDGWEEQGRGALAVAVECD
jgi:predicted transcriptional regulator